MNIYTQVLTDPEIDAIFALQRLGGPQVWRYEDYSETEVRWIAGVRGPALDALSDEQKMAVQALVDSGPMLWRFQSWGPGKETWIIRLAG